jgi:hypothetical protein
MTLFSTIANAPQKRKNNSKESKEINQTQPKRVQLTLF